MSARTLHLLLFVFIFFYFLSTRILSLREYKHQQWMQTWAGSSTPVFHYFLSGTHDPTFICYTHLHHPVSRSNFSFFSHSRYTLSWNAARHGDDFQSSARWPCIRHFYLYTSTDVTCQSRHRFYFQSKHFAFFTCRTFCENSSLTDLKCDEQKNYESLVFYRFKKN